MFSFLKKSKLALLGAATILAGTSLVGCNKGPKFIDYAHNGSVVLPVDYRGHDFFQDGIGQVTVKTYIDGDTTHFLQVEGDTSTILKSRYYGIDTPESTGNVQEYGKQASNFTHEKLANAVENGTIVVSSPFSIQGDFRAPEKDSTGERYLSLVWIHETKKNAPFKELILLNLWIVQEGLSWAKGTTEVPEYADTFSNAMNQAEKFKLKLWSGEPDPLFNYGSYETVSLLDIKNETIEFIKDPDHVNKYNGMKVRFTGTVAGYSNHNLYVEEFYPDIDEDTGMELETGQWAGINIFCGMGAIASDYTTIGTYLEVVGLAQDSDTFGFQITDTQGHWPASLKPTEDDCRILLTAEENQGVHSLKTYSYTISEFNAKIKDSPEANLENLFCSTVVFEPLTVSRVYVNKSGDEVTLYFKDCDFSAYVSFTYHGDPTNPGDAWMDKAHFLGKTFNVRGVYGYHYYPDSGTFNYQLIICEDSDLVCLTDRHGTVIADPLTVAEANNTTFVKDVYYFVNGEISAVTSADKTTGKASFTLVDEKDNTKSVKVVDAIVAAAYIDDYIPKVVVGSYVRLFGVPAKSGGVVTFTPAEIIEIKVHGQRAEDPLTLEEANEIASKLDNNQETELLYYFAGVIKEITSPLDDSRRISFVLEDNGYEYLVTDARIKSSEDKFSPEDIIVGATVLINAKLLKTTIDGNVVLTTYRNGCTIYDVLD